MTYFPQVKQMSVEGTVSSLGYFMLLTDKYCLFPKNVSSKVHNTLMNLFVNKNDSEFSLVPCSINDFWGIGVMAIGNNKGLVLPYTTTDLELQEITDALPDSMRVYRLEDSLTGLTSLNNLVLVNDTVGIASPELSKEARDKIQEVLGLKNLYLNVIERYPLPGTYFKLNNYGLLAPNDLTENEAKTLAQLLNIGVALGTCAGGKKELGKEFLVNSEKFLCDKTTYQTEINVAKKIFNIITAEDKVTMSVHAAEGTDHAQVLDMALLDSIL